MFNLSLFDPPYLSEAAPSVPANLTVDTFESYSDGDDIDGQTGGLNWDGPWITDKATTSCDDFEGYSNGASVSGLSGGVGNWTSNWSDRGSQSIVLTNSTLRAQIATGSIIRAVNFGTWSKVRIGCTFRLSTTSNVTGPSFAIGMLSGTTNVIGDPTVDYWLGLSSTDDFVYSAGVFSSLDIIPFVKIGAGYSTGGSLQNNMTGYHESVGQWGIYGVEITKGSPNYTVKWFGRYADTSYVMTEEEFENMVMAPPDPVSDGHLLSGGVPFAIDEGTYGTFNAIQVYWNSSSAIDIGTVCVGVF